MPTRILREYCDSDKFDGISAEAERLWCRLLTKADDFGRFHAEARRVKSACFPLSENPMPEIDKWLRELHRRDLIRIYEANGGKYLQIAKFNQRKRVAISKFPPPPSDDKGLQQKCQTDDGGPPTDDGHMTGICPPETYSEAQSEAQAHSETETSNPPNPPEGGGAAVLTVVKAPTRAERVAVAPIPPQIDTQEFRDAWTRWQQHRREIRHPLTPTTVQQQLRDFALIGVTAAIARIEHSIKNGWQGLFDPKGHANGKSYGQKPAPENRHANGFHETPALPVLGSQ